MVYDHDNNAVAKNIHLFLFIFFLILLPYMMCTSKVVYHDMTCACWGPEQDPVHAWPVSTASFVSICNTSLSLSSLLFYPWNMLGCSSDCRHTHAVRAHTQHTKQTRTQTHTYMIVYMCIYLLLYVYIYNYIMHILIYLCMLCNYIYASSVDCASCLDSGLRLLLPRILAT